LSPSKDVVSCITDEGFIARQFDPEGGPYPAAFQSGFTILERTEGRLPITLELIHSYNVVEAGGERGPWRASTTEWIYEISDSSDQLIVAFHWHPNSGRVTWPHIHAHGMHGSVQLHRLHPPTGRVSIEAVVLFMIVAPRRKHWRDVLARREEAFRQRCTWH
jgi:hypothetical protein